MMVALTTLEGIEDGTDIAVVQGQSRSKWTMSDGRLCDEQGDPLDTWFFAGLLAEGALHLANFSPPEPGEWFNPHGYTDRGWLVVGEPENGYTWVAVFNRGLFSGLHQVQRIVDTAIRQRPQWVTDQFHAALFAMGVRLREQRVSLDAMTAQRTEWQRLQSDLHYAQTYVNAAVNRLERVSSS